MLVKFIKITVRSRAKKICKQYLTVHKEKFADFWALETKCAVFLRNFYHLFIIHCYK